MGFSFCLGGFAGARPPSRWPCLLRFAFPFLFTYPFPFSLTSSFRLLGDAQLGLTGCKTLFLCSTFPASENPWSGHQEPTS